ncbi:uncharacterized protein LOC117169480 [Belonocnema kinseyi]|uniref:uncharacterized protein LOC117169480 n=1 Tax=Belonocnema kinseyi TaxID=2817044 RepID=UPI00143DB22A|nr:uncharacterized protein LOC117169480 [Belonocnema kinseyi]
MKMKICVFTLLFMLVMFLDSVQSMNPSSSNEESFTPPSRESHYFPKACTAGPKDVIYRNEHFCGQVQQSLIIYKVDCKTGEFETIQHHITKKHHYMAIKIDNGDLLIRLKFSVGKYIGTRCIELHKNDRKKMIDW